jgi:cell wall assembly regulator SMI1
MLLPQCTLAALITVPHDYATIQGAIDAAGDGDEVIVSPGTYYENIDFNGKNIVLRSTEPTSPSVVAATIIDGSRADSVVTFSGTEAASCAISGFTITNGYAREGGGIYGNSTLATIQYCNITTNCATYGDYPVPFGGGIARCNGTIHHNEISGNYACGRGACGGGLCLCHGLISDNLITRNLATGHEGSYGGGLCGCSGTIENNVISENLSGFGDGGGVNGCSGIIRNNIITNNSAAFGGAGLFWCGGTIQNNIISHNAASNGGGLAWCGGTVENNTIYGNSAYYSGGGLYGCQGVIVNCIVWANSATSDAQLYDSSTPSYSCIEDWTGAGNGNISSNPQLVEPDNHDFHLVPSSPCIDAGGLVALTQDFEGDPRPYDAVSEPRGDGSAFDIGADEYIVTPSPTPSASPTPTPTSSPTPIPTPVSGIAVPGNYATIQEAIDAASDGDAIIVSPGTYYENINLRGKNIVLCSTDPNNPTVVAATIIDGSQAGSVVTFTGTESSSCVLFGFTITNGYSREGGGICGNGALATIQNNIISNNFIGASSQGDAYGAGLYRCHGTIQNNIVASNIGVTLSWEYETGGGGLCDCDGTIRRNTISQNSAHWGGGLYDCSGTIEWNTISNNSAGFGAGIYACQGTVRNNRITDNSAAFGGGGSECHGVIENNIISVNSGHYGGGLYSCCGIIHNNTVARNSATALGDSCGGGLYQCCGSIVNCIIWGNSAPFGSQLYESSNPLYSCIESWTTVDVGNIFADPKFVDLYGGDYHLLPDSPCIDAGNTYYLPEGYVADMDGACRVAGPGVDMGCYEYGGFADSDGDLLSDSDEISRGSDLDNPDTDGDGLRDGAEVLRGTSPVIYNSPSGICVPADQPSIQQALFLAFPLEAVTVSPGIYYENLHFLGKDVVLRSTDPLDKDIVEGTMIDGSGAFSVISFNGTESGACVVKGLTIRNGAALSGGGIWGNGTMASIEHSRIINNSATPVANGTEFGSGGGIYGCDGSIFRNTISNNWASGGGGLSACHGVIQGNIISGNWADLHGGGIYGGSGIIQNNIIRENSAVSGGGLASCDATIQNNTIEANSAIRFTSSAGGGLYYCHGLIQSNVISGNLASIGGGLSECFWGTIRNNIICWNWANWGGGLETGGSVIENNTIYGNIGATQGGGIRFCHGTIRNCIIWNNTAPLEPQVSFCDAPSYCCIQDWTEGGTGNIAEDPQFADLATEHFHLAATSPCVDAGGTVSLAQDFEGHPRPYDGTSEPRGDGSDFDIGADEYCLAPTPTPIPFPCLSQRLPLAADVDGDGKCDLVQTMEDTRVGAAFSSGSSFGTISWCGYPGIWYDPEIGEFPLCGDVNGDGKDDLVQIKDWGDAWVSLSTGSSYNIATNWGAVGIVFGKGMLYPTRYWLPLIGDVDGDGNADLIQITERGDAWVSRSNGSAFAPAANYGFASIVYAQGEVYSDRYWVPLVGDVDGDGDADLIQLSEYGDAWVAWSDGTAFRTATYCGNPSIVFAPGITYPTRFWLPLAGDINGDNRTDLVQITEYGDVWVSLSDGPRFERARYAGYPGFVCDPSIGWLPLIGDVNGDGCCDLIQITSTTPPGDIWVSLGPDFYTAEKWLPNGDLCYRDTSDFPPPPQYRLNH